MENQIPVSEIISDSREDETSFCEMYYRKDGSFEVIWKGEKHNFDHEFMGYLMRFTGHVARANGYTKENNIRHS